MYTPKDTEQLKNIVLERKRAEADYHARIREAREEREAERERYNARMKEISEEAQSTGMTLEEAEAKEILDTFKKNVTSLAKELEEIGIKPGNPEGYRFIFYYGEEIPTNGRPVYTKFSHPEEYCPMPKSAPIRNSINVFAYPFGIHYTIDNRFYVEQDRLVRISDDDFSYLHNRRNRTEEKDYLSALKEINENWPEHREEIINRFYNEEKRKLDKINESLDSPDILKTVETAWYEKAPRTLSSHPRTLSSRPRRGDRIYIGGRYFEYYGDTEKLEGDTEKPEEEDGLGL